MSWWVRSRVALESIVRSARQFEPELWRNFQRELSPSRHWVDRAVVLGHAAATGLVVVAFTLLAEAASHTFASIGSMHPLAPYATLAWTPLLTMAIVWCTRRFAPGAAGSGIPQVILALDERMAKSRIEALVSLRLALAKVGLVSAGLLAGLSIGREGPTVQVGAGVMLHARRWLSPGSSIDAHDLMVAGAAAGIAAAFNTPLGGIVFALEQLTRRRHLSHSSLVIACIVLAGLVAIAVFGNETYFGRLSVQSVSWELLGPGVLVVLVAGLAGGLFSRLVILSLRGVPGRLGHWRLAHPLRFAAGCAFGVALIGVVTSGATAGAGYATTRALLEGQAEIPGIYTLLKFCATWLSAWTGAPAGVFAPSLAIGAGIGHDVSLLTGITGQAAIPLIALGMVGFLAATTQGPITAFIIVMEMVSGQAMVLSLMASALLAGAVSRLISPSLYGELALLLMRATDPPDALPHDPASQPDPVSPLPPPRSGQG